LEPSLGERMGMNVVQKPPKWKKERVKKVDSEFTLKMRECASVPNAGSFAQLVVQALHSGDKKLMTEVLYNRPNSSVQMLVNTVRRIPPQHVPKLITTLSNELLTNQNRSHFIIEWLKVTTTVHLAFLLTSRECREALSGLYQFVKQQEDIHIPLMSLHGKIEMLFAFAKERKASRNIKGIHKPVIVYNDDSDEDEEKEARKTTTDKLWNHMSVGKEEEKVSGTSEDDLKISETDDNKGDSGDDEDEDEDYDPTDDVTDEEMDVEQTDGGGGGGEGDEKE